MNKRTPAFAGVDHERTRKQCPSGGDRCRRHGRRHRQVAAQAGHPVKLYDNRRALPPGGRHRPATCPPGRKGKMQAAEREAISARLCPVDALEALADARLVIEAIVENLQVKQALFSQLEALCATDCILASNTSSLSITSLAAGLQRPHQVVGMHFFNPAPLMAPVEVVSGLATARPLPRAFMPPPRLGQAAGARSTPGFIVNRVARPFYAESLRLLQEGAADCASLDALLRDAGGFRMGAFELTDLIGHDVNYAVTCSVFDAFYGDFRFQPSLVQKELVDAGRLGRKTGQGFYSYAEGAERPQPAELHSPAIVDACVVEGDLGVMQPLAERLRQSGVAVTQRAGSGLIQVGDATLALSDGRLASQRAREDGLRNLVLLDLALDYGTATRLAISWSADTSDNARDQAVALLRRAGLKVTAVADLPGLVVLRTVAMLANEAADAVLQVSAAPPTSTWPCAPASTTPAARWPGPRTSASPHPARARQPAAQLRREPLPPFLLPLLRNRHPA